MEDTPLSRRRMLTLSGSVFAGSGSVTATSPSSVNEDNQALEGKDGDSVRVNIGYESTSGRRFIRSLADTVVHEFTFDALTVEMQRTQVDALRRHSEIRYVEPDSRVSAFPNPVKDNAPRGYLSEYDPWGIRRVGATETTTTGSGADVAIIDSGIDRNHLDLRENVGNGTVAIGGTVTDQFVGNGQDDDGHGTMCAGIVGALAGNGRGVQGVAPEATLHPVKSMYAPGAGLNSDSAKGIEYATDQDWDIISMSFAVEHNPGERSQLLFEACEYASNKGLLLVAAAGNDGRCRDCVSEPARYESVIAVSATNQFDELPFYSSTGPQIELAAPGHDIYSTHVGNTYLASGGTSFACPHVSGAGALLMGDEYNFSAEDARERLQETAEDIGLSSQKQGHGLLDVEAAVPTGPT